MAQAPVNKTSTPKYTISAKVSEKGAVSVYGLQKFPVTLYADQWEAVMSRAASISKFIADNRAKLIDKPTGTSVQGTTTL